MKTISMQKIIEKIIEDNPSQNKLNAKEKEIIAQYEMDMEKYLKELSVYKRKLKQNARAAIQKPREPFEPILNINDNQKRIDGMREKFKKIVEAFGIDSKIFKVNNKYVFPKQSAPYVEKVLLFDLNKTPVYSLQKDGEKEEHFNQKQLENIQKLRKTINKLIGYQTKNREGLEIAMGVTKKLKINHKKAEQYMGELISTLHPIAKKVSAIFDEELYPGLTLQERANIFHQIYLEVEEMITLYVAALDNKLADSYNEHVQIRKK